MLTNSEALRLTLDVFLLPFVLLASWALGGYRIRGHSLRIARLRPLHLHDVDYSYLPAACTAAPTALTCADARVQLHLPRLSDPRWATLTITDVRQHCADSCASAAHAEAVLWLFPYALRRTAGPWVSLTLDGADVRVYTSRRTPRWAQMVRANVVNVFIQGEVLRADYFRTALRFGPLLCAPVEETEETEEEEGAAKSACLGKCTPSPCGVCRAESPVGLDEITLQTTWHGFHVRNHQDRIYTFGRIETGLTKELVGGHGFFKIEVEEARWVKTHAWWQRQTGPINTRAQIVYALFDAPHALWTFLRDPSSHVNVYIPRLSATFDDFHIRDAELYRQGTGMVLEQCDGHGDAIRDVLWDSFAKAVHP